MLQIILKGTGKINLRQRLQTSEGTGWYLAFGWRNRYVFKGALWDIKDPNGEQHSQLLTPGEEILPPSG